MPTALRIRELFGYASLQGLATHGLRSFGVPPGGAFDHESFALANAMARNDSTSPALELAMAAVKIEILQPCLIAIVGAECEIFFDGRSARSQSAYQLLPSQVLQIGAPTKGCRCYLAVHGITSAKKFEQQIVSGNVLDAAPPSGQPGKVRTLSEAPSTIERRPIRVIGSDEIPRVPLTVSIHSNRVGVRLDGVSMQPGEEKLSEPSCAGAIQVTNDGGLVIHGPDGPTIGGYKKVGAVCSADMDRVGQLRPGDRITLQSIPAEEAMHAWAERNQMLEAKLKELRL